MRPGPLQFPPAIPLGPLATVAAVLFAVLFLPTCELARRGHLAQPLEFFVLADEASAATPVPYADPTGAVTGFVAHQPDLVITRLDELILETRQLPVFSGGRITGRQPHRFAHLHLHRKDRRRLAAFSETAVGRVVLVRMAGEPLSTTFLTEPLDRHDAFVISGPANEETLRVIERLQASLGDEGEIAFPRDRK